MLDESPTLHWNGDNSYLFVNGKVIFKFNPNDKNVNFPTQIYLSSISNGFGAADSIEVSIKRKYLGFFSRLQCY